MVSCKDQDEASTIKDDEAQSERVVLSCLPLSDRSIYLLFLPFYSSLFRREKDNRYKSTKRELLPLKKYRKQLHNSSSHISTLVADIRQIQQTQELGTRFSQHEGTVQNLWVLFDYCGASHDWFSSLGALFSWRYGGSQELLEFIWKSNEPFLVAGVSSSTNLAKFHARKSRSARRACSWSHRWLTLRLHCHSLCNWQFKDDLDSFCMLKSLVEW